jgi:hypothetical protein
VGVAMIFQASSLFPASLTWTVVALEAVIFSLALVLGAAIYAEDAAPA